MDYKEAARIYNIPVAAFGRMRRKGLIGKTIEQSDKPCLMFLCKMWGDDGFLRMQLSQKTKEKRLTLIKTLELNRLERHILTRFQKHYEQGDGQWLYAKMVEEEVGSLFKIPLDQKLRDTVRRMRQKAKNDVRKTVKVSI
ncbi:MAG: hypothetical protein Q7J27_00815 [Syntrophales bacterium]|nr:hypothetical protein [Syntrophales bacterium]